MGSGGGGQSTNTIQNSDPWSGAQPYLRDIMSQAQSQYRGGGPQYFPGQTYVAPNAQQQQAWDTNLGYANQVYGGQAAPQFGQATGALSSALQGGVGGAAVTGNSPAAQTALGQMLSGTPNYAGLQSSIDAANAPIMRQFEQDILPGLNQRASFMNNPTGSIKTLNRVLPELGERMSQNAALAYEGERQRALSAQQAGLGLYGQMAQGATGAQLAGAGLFPSIAQAGQGQAQAQGQYGDWQQQNAETALGSDIDRWNYQQGAPQANLQNYAGLVGGFGGLGGQSSSAARLSPSSGSQWTGAAGGALSGAALGAQVGGGPWGALIGGLAGGAYGYFSDRRLKRNIEPLGTMPNGLMLYRFKYLWDDLDRLGHMADEVREQFPYAYAQSPEGFGLVNYGAIYPEGFPHVS